MNEWKNCYNCIHYNVCSKAEENKKCENWYFISNPEVYGNIYYMFDPIFKWIEKHYPNGCKFIVDKTSAHMYIEHGVSCYDEFLRNVGESSMEWYSKRHEKTEE